MEHITRTAKSYRQAEKLAKAMRALGFKVAMQVHGPVTSLFTGKLHSDMSAEALPVLEIRGELALVQVGSHRENVKLRPGGKVLVFGTKE